MNPDNTVTELGSVSTGAKMRIVVTGGAGRIGNVVVQLLLDRGHEVTSVDRQFNASCRSCRFVFADLRQRSQVQPLLEQADAVIHLGEIPGVWRGLTPESVYADNTASGSIVLQTAADLQLRRFIYVSSCQVYGFAFGSFNYRPQVRPVCLPFDETHPLNPQNAYAVGKMANELYARMVSTQSGLSTALIRLPAVAKFDIKDPWMRNQLARMDDVDGMGHYAHVNDVARFMALAVENPRPGCEAYHLSAKDIIFGGTMKKMLELHYPDYPALPADWPDYQAVMDTRKAREHFGWEPTYSLRDEMARQVPTHP